jgi:diamine N-acetyltransferase
MPHFNAMESLRFPRPPAQTCDYRKRNEFEHVHRMNAALREVTKETVRTVCKLDAGAQVAPNAVSVAQAHFYSEAWFRAIYADDVLIGFITLYDPTLAPQPQDPEFLLWRLMIGSTQQGGGYGRDAVRRLVEQVRTRPGAQRLLVSHIKWADRVGRFYGALGFRYTGVEVDNELVMAYEVA